MKLVTGKDSREFYLGESTKRIREVAGIEEVTISQYLDSYGRIKDVEVAKMLFSVIVDTIVHRENMKAVKRVLNELIKLEKTLQEKKRVLSEKDAEEMKKAIEKHLRIEKYMASFYRELSEDLNQPEVLRDIRIFQANEELHHKILENLLKYYL